MRDLRHSLLVVAAIGLAATAGACRDHAVSLDFQPEVGDRFRYRYELTATLTREIEGSEPEVTTVDTELLVDQEVIARTPSGARVKGEVRRDGGARSTVVAVVDQAGSLEGIELVQGFDAEVFGVGDPQGLVADPAERLPDHPLAAGDRWTIEDGARRGEGRIVRFGVEDDRDVVHVHTSTDEPLGTVDGDEGRVRAGSRTVLDVGDGAVRTGRSWSHGVLEGSITPPEDVAGEPVRAVVRYDVEVRVTRLQLQS